MAKIHGLPGEWARVKGLVFGLWPLFLGMFGAGFAAAITLYTPIWGLIVFLVSVIYCYWRLFKGLQYVERYYKGAQGEILVSTLLSQLPAAYHVFNDFKALGEHIDHVVVGPSGVFSVETKYWQSPVTIEEGHILVGGRLPSRMPVPQALKEARLVHEELQRRGCKTDVVPILAFASNTFTDAIVELDGVMVMNANRLLENILAGRELLNDDEINRLIGLMEIA